jgi:hypothetical protein
MNDAENKITEKLLKTIESATEPELPQAIHNYVEFLRGVSLRVNLGPKFPA